MAAQRPDTQNSGRKKPFVKLKNMYDLIIVGAGGFARELRQFVGTSFPPAALKLKGFLSNNPHDFDHFEIDEPILGDPETYVPLPKDRFLLAIGSIEHRKKVVEQLKLRQARFLTLIHPTAYVDANAKIGEGCVIYPFASVMNAATIGDFVTMSIYASAGHDAQIGNYCNLSPYATMNGFSVLEEDVFLGTHASVLASLRVGRGSKVSANSVVTHNVQPDTLVFGVPGRHARVQAGTDRGQIMSE
jgi:sugar O-acyltransferase (sialic acid O-acetyltransferase NeuD family)